MSRHDPLPRLAALFLTHGHRVPPEVMSILARSGQPGGEWELPLDGTRRYGEEPAPDPAAAPLRLAPPEY